MKIIRNAHSGAPAQLRTETFTGLVYADPVLAGEEGVAVNSVFFAPGARTYWHSHESGQFLYVVSGSGLIRAETSPGRVIRAGDVVWVPPGERHWHGGGPMTMLLHVAVSLGKTTWLQEVTEAEYGQEAARRQAVPEALE
jgi:quercetin dioxygenase-like cupin family protein